MRLCPPACLSASFLTQQPLWHCRIPLCNPECRYEDAVSGGPGMAARRQSLAALLKLGALEACPAWILLFFVTTNLPTFQDPAPHKRTASAPSADVAEEALELLWHSFLALRRNEEGELTMRGLGRLTKSPRNPYLPLLWSAFFDASGAKVRAQRMQRRDAGFWIRIQKPVLNLCLLFQAIGFRAFIYGLSRISAPADSSQWPTAKLDFVRSLPLHPKQYLGCLSLAC